MNTWPGFNTLLYKKLSVCQRQISGTSVSIPHTMPVQGQSLAELKSSISCPLLMLFYLGCARTHLYINLT